MLLHEDVEGFEVIAMLHEVVVSSALEGLPRLLSLDVGVQAHKPGSSLKALSSISQSTFETRCFQAGVKLALPHLDGVEELAPAPEGNNLVPVAVV